MVGSAGAGKGFDVDAFGTCPKANGWMPACEWADEMYPVLHSTAGRVPTLHEKIASVRREASNAARGTKIRSEPDGTARGARNGLAITPMPVSSTLLNPPHLLYPVVVTCSNR